MQSNFTIYKGWNGVTAHVLIEDGEVKWAVIKDKSTKRTFAIFPDSGKNGEILNHSLSPLWASREAPLTQKVLTLSDRKLIYLFLETLSLIPSPLHEEWIWKLVSEFAEAKEEMIAAD